ncbi:MAG: hypothetical protein OSJ51_11855 [Parabacteroides distasonis]|nr:hypothetical protein [Parabacteroides distasonis]
MLLLIQPLKSRKYGRVRSGEPAYGKTKAIQWREIQNLSPDTVVSMSVPVTSTA